MIEDVLADAEYGRSAGRDVGGYRTLLGIPIRHDGDVAGVLALTRNEVRPFDDAAIRLATAFADQAAIGIHNARLLETVERQRAQLARFLSPQVAALVSSHDGEQLLAGHRREITLFCDLRNFTVFSEVAEPEEVLDSCATTTRRWADWSSSTRTLEHFAGDGFMTFFNDPDLQPDHAARAVSMAVSMRERFEDMAAGWRKRGHVPRIGIGIATGYATVGRIGFEGRYDYGAIGNAVILAARLSSEAAPGRPIAPRTLAAAEDAVRVSSSGMSSSRASAGPSRRTRSSAFGRRRRWRGIVQREQRPRHARRGCVREPRGDHGRGHCVRRRAHRHLPRGRRGAARRDEQCGRR